MSAFFIVVRIEGALYRTKVLTFKNIIKTESLLWG